MTNFKKISSTAFAAGAFFAMAVPASAAVVLCTGNCVTTDENVLVNAATASTITGATNTSNVGVTFSSTTDAMLVGGANGQASVGSLDELLNQLTFTLASGFGFTSALFNLAPVPGTVMNEATSVFVNFTNADGTFGQITQAIGTNGQNFIGITGTNGEIFTSAGFTANPSTTGISELKQLRLGGVAALGAVPEPATWAMMLLGFGLLGGMLRSTKTRERRISFAT